MATVSTAEEIAQQYIAVMGQELGQQYHLLRNECQWAHFKWEEFESLFGASQAQVDLLNGSAPLFFRIVQDLLWEDALIHLCRMTDPPSRGKKQNLTIQNLPDLVKPEIRKSLETLISQADQKTQFARDWRNRRIAHKDLDLALKTSIKALTPGSRSQVTCALQGVASALNFLENHYCGSLVMYKDIKSVHGAESLLYYLGEGLDAEAARRERLLSGQPLPGDFEPRRQR